MQQRTRLWRVIWMALIGWIGAVGYLPWWASSLVWGQVPIGKHFSPASGLPGTTIYRICQAEDGRIWLGTNLGLVRTDGHGFDHFDVSDGVPGDEVVQLEVDPSGRLWLGTFSGGLAFWEGGKIYNRDNTDWLPDLKSVPMAMGAMESGALLVATQDSTWLLSAKGQRRLDRGWLPGRYYWDRGTGLPAYLDNLEQGFPLHPVRNLPQGQEWVAQLPQGWWAFEDHLGSRFLRADAVSRMMQDSLALEALVAEVKLRCQDCRLHNLVKDREGNWWIGTQGKGLFYYQEEQGKLVQVLTDQSINALFCDQEGNLWVGTDGQGLFLFPRSGQGLYRWEAPDKKNLKGMSALALEGNNGLLIGYENGDLVRLDQSGHLLQAWSPQETGLKGAVRSFCPLPAGGILAFGEKGFSFQSWPERGSWRPGEQQFSVKDWAFSEEDELFLGTSAGIFGLEIQTNEFQVGWYSQIRMTALAWQSGSQSLLAAGLDSIWMLQEGYLKGLFSARALHSRVTQMEVDGEGNLWLGTAGNGLFCYQKGALLHFGEDQGLPSNHCTALALGNEDQVWLGTQAGLVGIRAGKEGWSRPRIQSFQTLPGMPQGPLLQIFPQGDSIWLATRDEVLILVPQELMLGRTGPPIKLASLRIGESDTLLGAEAELSPDENSLRFQFYDPAYRALDYQYRLIGIDSQWIDLAEPVVQLDYLAAGQHYRLEVRARGFQGSWGPVWSQDFLIRNFWYRSTWFFVLVVAGIFGLGLLGMGWRQNRRLRAFQEREENRQAISRLKLTALKARMNPHFIFNSMNAIQHMVALDQEETSLDFIARFSQLMRKILDNSDLDFIALGEEVALCRLYLEVESIRLSEEFDFQILVDASLDLENLAIPPMLIQPFLENALWHGLMPLPSDRKLCLEFSPGEEGFWVRIEDNGIGRDAAAALQKGRNKAVRSQATRIFTQRMELLNRSFPQLDFHFEVEDLRDEKGAPEGTRVRLYFPYLRAKVSL